MSDDQTFDVGGKPENKTVTAMRELVTAVKDPATLHHHHYPTIGQTWTDPADQGWQDISTAPKDGTIILCFFKNGETGETPAVSECFWDTEVECWMDALRCHDLYNEPTHWSLPLPHPHLIR